MPWETDAQSFANCPKSCSLKLETPSGPTSILNGKRSPVAIPFRTQQSLEKEKCLVTFFLANSLSLSASSGNHVRQDLKC